MPKYGLQNIITR